MTGWRDIERELDVWHSNGRTATFWWRDDDAVAVTDPLERLLSLSEEIQIPVALAVIPLETGDDLRLRLAANQFSSVLQHGYSHRNWAPPDAKRAELTAPRDRDKMLLELAEGRARLSRFANALPALVPPWNRIDSGMISKLPGIGLKTLSTYGPRQTRQPAPGLRCVNTHIDIIAWRQGGNFVGSDAALDLALRHLTERRNNIVDESEPTGLLTHHLVHDQACWHFIGDFLNRTRDHPAARWVEAREAFLP